MTESLVPGVGWHRMHPPPRLGRPALVRPVPVDPSGKSGPTRGASRSPRWRHTGIGLFVPVDAEFTQPAQRILEATGAMVRPCVVTGWASLHLAGARWFEGSNEYGGELPVPLRVGPHRRATTAPGITVDRRRVLPGEIVMRHGIACLNVHRSLLDEVIRRGDLRQAVAAIDMVLFAELTTLARFRAWLDTVPRTPGLPLVRAACSLAVEGAQSPQETALRLLWQLDARLPPPRSNVDLHGENGAFLGRPDLVSPELAVLAEYNGAHHLDVRRHRRDLTRDDGFRNHGLQVVSVVAGELRRPELVVARLHAAVRRAQESEVPARWVLHGPSGPPPDLDARFESWASQLSRARRKAAYDDAPTTAQPDGLDVR